MTDQRPENGAVEFQPIGKGLYRIVVHNRRAIRDAAEKALQIPGEELRCAQLKPSKLRAWVSAIVRKAAMKFMNGRS